MRVGVRRGVGCGGFWVSSVHGKQEPWQELAGRGVRRQERREPHGEPPCHMRAVEACL